MGMDVGVYDCITNYSPNTGVRKILLMR